MVMGLGACIFRPKGIALLGGILKQGGQGQVNELYTHRLPQKGTHDTSFLGHIMLLHNVGIALPLLKYAMYLEMKW